MIYSSIDTFLRMQKRLRKLDSVEGSTQLLSGNNKYKAYRERQSVTKQMGPYIH